MELNLHLKIPKSTLSSSTSSTSFTCYNDKDNDNDNFNDDDNGNGNGNNNVINLSYNNIISDDAPFPIPLGDHNDTPTPSNANPAIPVVEKEKIKEALLKENTLQCKIFSNELYLPRDLTEGDTDIRFIKICHAEDSTRTLFYVPFIPDMKKQIELWVDAAYKSITFGHPDDIKKIEKLKEMYKPSFIKMLCFDGDNFTQRKYDIAHSTEEDNKLSFNEQYFINRFLSNLGVVEPHHNLFHLHVIRK